VRKRADIYNYERALNRLLANLKRSRIDGHNKASILRFHEHCLTQGLSLARTIKYITTLRMIAKWPNKPFEDATKEDILKIVQKVELADYSDWTKRDYKSMLRIFYRWLRQTEDYPEEVSWVRLGRQRKKILPEELLTEEEVKRMAEAATNQRDRAFVLVLYESGCRIGEIMSLRIRSVQFDEHGAVLMVSGKTGDRRVRIIASVPALASWLDIHPRKNDPNAPLWICLGTKYGKSILTYSAMKETLKELAKKAGIKKRVYPCLFRHSRATRLANSLTEAQLKQLFGWTQDSRMASTYIHLSGRDVDEALLRLHGVVKKNNETQENQFTIKPCPRCKNKNSPEAKFCNSCGLCLDEKTTMQIDELRLKADRLLSEHVRNPEVLNALLKGIEKIKENLLLKESRECLAF
jgi:integrase